MKLYLPKLRDVVAVEAELASRGRPSGDWNNRPNGAWNNRPDGYGAGSRPSPMTGRPTSGWGEQQQNEVWGFFKDVAFNANWRLVCQARAAMLPTGGLTPLAWMRCTTTTADPTVMDAQTSGTSDGWRLIWRGTAGIDTSRYSYVDTGGVTRADNHTFSGGTLSGTWHVIGGARSGIAPFPIRALVDTEVGAAVNGTVAPDVSTSTRVTVFGLQSNGSANMSGLLVNPIVLAKEITALEQSAFVTDGGLGLSGLYSDPTIVFWPYPDLAGGVVDGDMVLVQAIDENSVVQADVTVFGVPGMTRGIGDMGPFYSDSEYLRVPYVNSSLVNGKTIIVWVRGTPGTLPTVDDFVWARNAATHGGIAIAIRSADGITGRFQTFRTAGATAYGPTNLTPVAVLGDNLYYVMRVPATGAGAHEAAIFSAAGVKLVTNTATPVNPTDLNGDARVGRNEGATNFYAAGVVPETWEIDGVLTDAEVAQVIAGTWPGTPDRTLAGFTSNVLDQIDPTILWGSWDISGTNTVGQGISMEFQGTTALVPGT